jgi:hypothetical protein
LRIEADVKLPKLRAITPVWAQRIEVERKKDALLITGWGHISNPFSPQQVPAELRSKLDILQGLRRYALRHLGQPCEPAGVYQFADATDDEKLIAFVTEFGPVSGKFLGFERAATWDIKVKETLASLRREQRIFRTMVQIVQQVNRNGRADFDALRRLLNALRIEVLDPEVRALEDIASVSPNATKDADLIPMAHQTLCILFNSHLPRLFPIDGEVIELPSVDFTGIRDALYFQLRLDYLAQRTIGTCLNCGGHFTVFKRGTRGCKETCQRALRNQRYWNKSKATINAERREKKTGRK